MFKKKSKLYKEHILKSQIFEDGFLSGVNYALFILESQKSIYGDIASIEDLKDLIAKDL